MVYVTPGRFLHTRAVTTGPLSRHATCAGEYPQAFCQHAPVATFRGCTRVGCGRGIGTAATATWPLARTSHPGRRSSCVRRCGECHAAPNHWLTARGTSLGCGRTAPSTTVAARVITCCGSVARRDGRGGVGCQGWSCGVPVGGCSLAGVCARGAHRCTCVCCVGSAVPVTKAMLSGWCACGR